MTATTKNIFKRARVSVIRKHWMYLAKESSGNGQLFDLTNLGPNASTDSVLPEKANLLRSALEELKQRRRGTGVFDSPFWRQMDEPKAGPKEWQLNQHNGPEGPRVQNNLVTLENPGHPAHQLKQTIDLGDSKGCKKKDRLGPQDLVSGNTKDLKLNGVPASGIQLVRLLKAQAEEFKASGVPPEIRRAVYEAAPTTPTKFQVYRQFLMEYPTAVHVLSDPSPENCNLFVRAGPMLAKNRATALDLAVANYEKLVQSGLPVGLPEIHSLMVVAANWKAPEAARNFYLKLRENLLTPTCEVFTTLMVAHIRASKDELAGAFAISRKMEDFALAPNLISYTVLMEGCLRWGQPEKAFQVFNSCRTWKAILPDTIMFNVCLKGCLPNQLVEKALNFLEDMKLSEVNANAKTYQLAMHNCALRAEDPRYFRKTFEFYRQILAEDWEVSKKTRQLLVLACSKAGNLPALFSLLRREPSLRLQAKPIFPWVLKTFANAQLLPKLSKEERVANIQHAWQVFQASHHKMNAPILNTLVQLYARGGYPKYAVDSLQLYAHFQVALNRNTYATLLDMFFELKDAPRYLTLFYHSALQVRDTTIYNRALEMALTTNSSNQVVRVMQKMLEVSIYPTPQVTAQLAQQGRLVVEIHEMVQKLTEAHKHQTHERTSRETNYEYTQIEEHKLRTAHSTGRDVQDNETLEQESRRLYFKKLKKLDPGFKFGYRSKAENKARKLKGGPHYEARQRKKPSLYE